MTGSFPDTGRPRPVMADVARHAGVALGTVSNVLNNPQIVAHETRERVLKAIDELGFVRNNAARSLVTGRADTVGFVIVDVGNSFFVEMARGVEEELDEHDIRLLLANSDVDLAKQDSYIGVFEEAKVAGILLAPLDAPLDAARAARHRGMPVVHVNWPGDEDSCGVVVDEELGGYLAARHLLDQGLRRLAFAGGPFSLSAIAQRHTGARRAVAEVDGADLETIETHSITVRGGYALGEQLSSRPAAERPEGLVSASDALAAGAIQTLQLAGVRVPADIAVVGYDNNHFAQDSSVPITSVGQPGHEMGRIAAQVLYEEISSPAEHRHRTITLTPTLFPRTSSAAV
ncbi:LacI family DNA-binding transcriptional regulator [Microbacterium sp. NPDC028030]|uniref:LacI family DNA-binding transcriptional regulator n=1 Tax=Microbacterium sp. NPDC028030 TaxID=3155124 RepID=UPI0033D4F489